MTTLLAKTTTTPQKKQHLSKNKTISAKTTTILAKTTTTPRQKQQHLGNNSNEHLQKKKQQQLGKRVSK